MDLTIPRELKPICIPTFARYFKRLPTTCAEMRAYDLRTFTRDPFHGLLLSSRGYDRAIARL
jgi:hypothetical protein